jgi:GTP-binding protein
MLIAHIDYDDYIGRTATGKIFSGRVSTGDNIALVKQDGRVVTGKVSKLLGFEGVKQVELAGSGAGDIVTLAGFDEVGIGETFASTECPESIPYVSIDEPTMAMNFMVNSSPLAGKEGKFVTSRQIFERLSRELRTNISLRVEKTQNPDSFKVSGRGELHLSILIENMRREGYELAVSKPEAIYREIDGKLCEPMEYLLVEVPEEYQGTVIEKLGMRKAEMVSMQPMDGINRLEYVIPARGLIGFRSEFLTDTRGTGLMTHTFHEYAPHKGLIPGRKNGSLIAMEKGETAAYALFNLQERGVLFVGPRVEVYEGMIIGRNSKENDLVVNPGKGKKLTNMRAAGSDDNIRLTPPQTLSLEQAMEYIDDDELVELTPTSIRLRKKVLGSNDRKKFDRIHKKSANF